MRLFPSPLLYLCNPMFLALLFVMALVLFGCNDPPRHEVAIEKLKCRWSSQHAQCFCASTVAHGGYLTWVPPVVCGKGDG